MSNKIIYVLIIVFLYQGCEKKEESSSESFLNKTENIINKDKIDSRNFADIKRPNTAEDFLMIINYTPLNCSFDFIKLVFPTVSDLDNRYRRYSKAYLKTLIFNKETTVEFNISLSNKLQNVSFHIRKLKANIADSLYKELQIYYSSKFGEFKEEINKNPSMSGYPIFHGSFWDSVNVGFNENGDNSSLDWGF